MTKRKREKIRQAQQKLLYYKEYYTSILENYLEFSLYEKYKFKKLIKTGLPRYMNCQKIRWKVFIDIDYDRELYSGKIINKRVVGIKIINDIYSTLYPMDISYNLRTGDISESYIIFKEKKKEQKILFNIKDCLIN